ncbi:MAG: hypothetical protein LBK06_08665 [Planctomycetaceae bacterium]|nr:hypothetical protein [Planctomycetaceae bacterium]
MLKSENVSEYAEAVLKSRKRNTASAATRNDCSRAKPTAHTGSGIIFRFVFFEISKQTKFL